VALPGPEGQSLLEAALDQLIAAEGPLAHVLWSWRYTQRGRLSNGETQWSLQDESCPNHYLFPPPSLDFAFEDDILDIVKEAWKKIVGEEVDDDDFMMFDDREGTSDQ
jgi:hypothetical protein